MSVGVYVRLKNEEVWMKFKEYVLKKHQKLHGALGLELTKAIEHYLQTQETPAIHTHTNSQSTDCNGASSNGGNSRTLKSLKTIVSQILTETEKEIPQTRVEQIIASCAGGEDRTMRRYLRHLINDYRILVPVRRIPTSKPREIKFIYEVNLDEAKKLIRVHM